jgi:hypothetical protein
MNKLLYLNKNHEEHIVKWQQANYEKYHSFIKINDFDEYNYLIEFNHFVEPKDYDPIIDRTQSITHPYNYKVIRPWVPPASSPTIENFFEQRVQEYLDQQQHINIFWSGGIDSTAIVAAFLIHARDHSQIRILYTRHSVNEHPEFFKLLQKYNVELYHLTLSSAINDKLDGIAVDGLSLDERTAGISQLSFLQHGGDILFRPWQDYFRDKDVSPGFIDFFDNWFLIAQRPIVSLLDARWWFYLQLKSQGPNGCRPRFIGQMFKEQQIEKSFYNCQLYDDYVYHNIDKIIRPKDTYHQHKLFLKEYLKKFDNNNDYYEYSIKINSNVLHTLSMQIDLVKNQNWSFLFENGDYAGTPNLPFLSVIELEKTFGNSIDYLFNFGRSK